MDTCTMKMQEEDMFDWNAPAVHRAVVEQINEAVIVVDREGIVRVWNAGAEAVFGHAAAEMLGGGLEAIVPERLWQAHDSGFRRAVESGQAKHAGRVMTTRAVHKSGARRYVDISFSMLRDADGAVFGVAAVGRDCTEREEAKRAAQATAGPTPAAAS